MILINNKKVDLDKFGDGTLKCEVPQINSTPTITWAYDNDGELFALACLTDILKEKFDKVALVLPYVPNARQDRRVSGRIFTLKTFCRLINNMGFCSVEILDPHSSVTMALLDNVVDYYFKNDDQDDVDAIMFPDAGAAKKYTEQGLGKNYKNIIIGNKKRDDTGRIVEYELINFPEGVKTVKIKDDICSYGGTFVEAAKALRSKGVEKIILEVSHCEANIFKGNVFDYVDEVITTDSILDLDNFDHEGVTEEKLKKLKITHLFRREI